MTNSYQQHEVIQFRGRDFRIWDFKTVAGRPGVVLVAMPTADVLQDTIDRGDWDCGPPIELPLDRLRENRLVLVA